MAEHFPEPSLNREPSPDEIRSIEAHQRNEDRDVELAFDRIVDGKEGAKENAKEVLSDVKESLARNPRNSELFYLKENVIDQLAETKIFRTDETLRDGVREALDKRYQDFWISGRVGFNFKNNRPEVREPNGISFGIEKDILTESRLLKDPEQIHFYEPGTESKLTKEDLKKGIIITTPLEDERRRSEVPEAASPTAALFDVLYATGHFDHLLPDHADVLDRLVKEVEFGRIVDEGEWLEPTAKNFFDENDITLFKINRLLPPPVLKELLYETIGNASFDPKNVNESREAIRLAIFQNCSRPLTANQIDRYDLDSRGPHGERSIIEEQKATIRESRKYLEEGKNRTKSAFGDIIYVRGNRANKAQKLSANVVAMTAKAPEGKRGWNKVDGYIEAFDNYVLGYVPKERLNDLADALEKEADIQLMPVGEKIVKFFVGSKNGKLPEGVFTALEDKVFKKPPTATAGKPKAEPDAKPRKPRLKMKNRA